MVLSFDPELKIKELFHDKAPALPSCPSKVLNNF